MGCLGVHFAITDEEVKHIKSIKSDDERLEYIQEEIEEKYFEENPDYAAESDKAWDAMHRLLSDGDLSYTTGPEPLRFTVIGGEPLYFKDDYIMSLKTIDQVKSVASVLPNITESEFQQLYNKMDEKRYGCQKSDDDFGYTWEYFLEVVELYKKAASENRNVLFTADQ